MEPMGLGEERRGGVYRLFLYWRLIGEWLYAAIAKLQRRSSVLSRCSEEQEEEEALGGQSFSKVRQHTAHGTRPAVRL